ncbi:MAG: hypothetical protein LQ344_006163 [Seirophora lacunosa]|nr:MAG: hypothetical protein LQ344_006163 [Seirophora lacunosa]
MFREPEVLEVKTVVKADVTAPARSSIRRQRSVNHFSRNSRGHRPLSYSRSHRHHDRLPDTVAGYPAMRSHADQSSAERAFDLETSANWAHAEASRRQRYESGRATLRDALSYEHPNRSTDMRRDHSYPLNITSFQNALRRPRQRMAFWEISAEASNPRLRAARVRTPSPAYNPSSRYTSHDRSSHDTSQLANRVASLTPRFAPAHPLPDADSAIGLVGLRYDEWSHVSETTDDSMTNELPPLHRISRRYSPRPRHGIRPGTSGHHVVDGLGDRWRSISPEDDTWDTLLATMPPDERLPSSASTSFGSDEGFAFHENLGNIPVGSIAEALDMYPVQCENTDTDFSDTDEPLPRMVEGPVRHLSRQVAGLSDRGLVEAAESRSETDGAVHSRGMRRPDRERL